ncbi:hypothetical protein BDW72DRAFT_206972 [Aspergillus terricola var. indicus]
MSLSTLFGQAGAQKIGSITPISQSALFALDDFVMVGAYILQGIASSLVTVSTYHGLGSNVTTLDYGHLVRLLKYVMIAMPFGVLAPLSVHSLRQKLFWLLIVLQLVLNIVPCVLQYTQCSPIEGLWNPKVVLTHCSGAKMVQRWGYIQGGMSPYTNDGCKMVLSLILSLSLL